MSGADEEHLPVFFDLVLIAASAGGLTPIQQVLSALPVDFGAALVVLLHLPPHFKSRLAEILDRHTPLVVKQICDHERILPGVVYVSPPDFHTLIQPGGLMVLEESAPVHFTRPSADLLFSSAATCYGKRTIGVILSGMGQDGRQGITDIKRSGGVVIAQNQDTAAFFGMPGAAIRSGKVDFILPLDLVARAITQLVRTGKFKL